jgi:hypothetical protein
MQNSHGLHDSIGQCIFAYVGEHHPAHVGVLRTSTFGAVSRTVRLAFSTNSRRMRLISEMGRMTSPAIRESSERRLNPVPPSFSS